MSKTDSTPSNKEQIEALMSGCFRKIEEKYPHIETWEELFTVTKSEILSYIKSNYSLRDLGLFEEQDNFRLNVREEKNRFKTFTRCWDTEVRGLPYKEYNIKYFSTEDEVYEEYVDHITGCSGTGLTFEDKEED
jgi:hypothetical protein